MAIDPADQEKPRNVLLEELLTEQQLLKRLKKQRKKVGEEITEHVNRVDQIVSALTEPKEGSQAALRLAQ